MKRILLLACLLAAGWTTALAQDAATQERLDKLSGQIEDLIAAQKAQQRQVTEIIQELERTREQMNKPTDRYATTDDLNRLREAIKEVDRKRMEDADKIEKEIAKLAKLLLAAPPKKVAANPDPTPAKSKTPDRFFEHTVAKGDTLSTIVQAYREQNVKVSIEQILKANPGLKPERMLVGDKIIIPAP